MKVQNQVVMQVFSSGQRTRAQEPFEAALQKAKDRLVQVGTAVPVLLSGGAGAALAQSAAGLPAVSSGTDFGALQQSQMDANMQYLRLQMEVQAENRWFTTLSNVIRSRHDTARAAIGNLRA